MFAMRYKSIGLKIAYTLTNGEMKYLWLGKSAMNVQRILIVNHVLHTLLHKQAMSPI